MEYAARRGHCGLSRYKSSGNAMCQRPAWMAGLRDWEALRCSSCGTRRAARLALRLRAPSFEFCAPFPCWLLIFLVSCSPSSSELPQTVEQGAWTGPCNASYSVVRFKPHFLFELGESSSIPLIGSNYSIDQGILRINTDSRDGWTYSGPIITTSDRLNFAVSLTGANQGVLPEQISCELIRTTS